LDELLSASPDDEVSAQVKGFLVPLPGGKPLSPLNSSATGPTTLVVLEVISGPTE
jgi:hypothetical protein